MILPTPPNVKAWSFSELQIHKYQEAIQFIDQLGIETNSINKPVARGEVLKFKRRIGVPKNSTPAHNQPGKLEPTPSQPEQKQKLPQKPHIKAIKSIPPPSTPYQIPYIPPTQNQPSQTQSQETPLENLPLLKLEDLKYVGAFKLPAGKIGDSQFEYGGTALAYNPERDSLFVAGHDWYQLVAEIKIPQITQSSNLEDLKTAEIIQSFADITDGKMNSVDEGGVKVGGLMVYNNKLYGTVYSYYDADGDQKLSHFVSPLNLDNPSDVSDIFQVGYLGAGFVSGYMTPIPEKWQSRFGGPVIVGQCCLAIISRTSLGPSASVFNPENLSENSPAAITPLVYYPISHPLATWDATDPNFNGSTVIPGGAFVNNSRSVLFFGRHGIGPFCYGGGDECKDPTSMYKGTHAYPYIHQIWAYDALDLLAVKENKKLPWEVRPYGLWKLELPFDHASKVIAGITHDPISNRIFISQSYTDSSRPVIHVFKIE